MRIAPIRHVLRFGGPLLVGLLLSLPASAVTVNPTGVNLRQSGPSTAFLTFRGLTPTQTPEEGIWCGELLVSGACDPTTIFGRLPARLDLSRASGTNNFTDIMTVPASVLRRAYEAAAGGSASQFFYVRRFSDTAGPDEFVAVTCRMAGGGANSPLSITDIEIRFEGDETIQYVSRDAVPSRFEARIRFNGTGRLKGRWEVALPGDPAPTELDLLPEGSLPAEARAGRNRYTLLSRFDVFLPPKGTTVLPGPDPRRLPVQQDGPYQVLLRIEASDAAQSRSNTGTFVTQAGGAAGFSIPPLRYFVGTGAEAAQVATDSSRASLRVLTPREGERHAFGQPIRFRWIGDSRASLHKLEVRAEELDVLSALVEAGQSTYLAPPFLQNHAAKPLRWRVIALDEDGDALARSEWSDFAIEPASP